MGYSSQVAIAMFETDYNSMIEKAKEECPQAYKYINNYSKIKRWKYSKEIIVLSFNWVKWYEEYPEVRFIENYIHSLKDYEFARAGESMEYLDVDNERVHEDINNTWYCVGACASVWADTKEEE